MLTQLFGFITSQAYINKLLNRSETFPLRLRCSQLQYLSIAVSNEFFDISPGIMCEVGDTLVELVLRFRMSLLSTLPRSLTVFLPCSADTLTVHRNTYSHMRIGSLWKLMRFTLRVSPRLWQHTSLTADTWSVVCKRSKESRFTVDFLYDSAETGALQLVTDLQMQSILSGRSPTRYLGGVFHVTVVVQTGDVMADDDVAHLSSLLDNLRDDPYVYAAIDPYDTIYVS